MGGKKTQCNLFPVWGVFEVQALDQVIESVVKGLERIAVLYTLSE